MISWPSGQGAGFPIQGSCVQNHRVTQRSTYPSSIKDFYPSDVDKLSTRNFWELIGKK